MTRFAKHMEETHFKTAGGYEGVEGPTSVYGLSESFCMFHWAALAVWFRSLD